MNSETTNSNADSSEKPSKTRRALSQILPIVVKNTVLMGYGMTLGFPTILIPSLSGADPSEKISLGEEALSWIGSLNLIFVPIGCFLTGAITQPLGRKKAMQLVNIPFVIAWILFWVGNDLWQIFFALCLTGVAGGLLEAPVLTYVAEITTPDLRGILSSTSAVSVIIGVLSQFIMGTFLKWRTVAAISCFIPIVSICLLFFVPESPHWLISKNRLEEAHESIAWLRGWTTLEGVKDEFNELCEHLGKGGSKQNEEQPLTIKEKIYLFKEKSFLWPFSIVCTIFFLAQFCGMTTLQTYAIKIFSTLKVPIDKYYATISLGVAEIFGSILCICLVHRIGKRKLSFMSLTSCGICFFITATYACVVNIQGFHQEEPKTTNILDSNDIITWIPLVFLMLAAFFCYAGIRIMPWLLIGEVYCNRTRAVAAGFSGAVSYIFGFISNKIFFQLVTILTLPGTFWLYSCISFIGVVWIYFVLPETEGKSLREITEHFAETGKLDNRVKRWKGQSAMNGEINRAFSEEHYKNIDTKF